VWVSPRVDTEDDLQHLLLAHLLVLSMSWGTRVMSDGGRHRNRPRWRRLLSGHDARSRVRQDALDGRVDMFLAGQHRLAGVGSDPAASGARRMLTVPQGNQAGTVDHSGPPQHLLQCRRVHWMGGGVASRGDGSGRRREVTGTRLGRGSVHGGGGVGLRVERRARLEVASCVRSGAAWDGRPGQRMLGRRATLEWSCRKDREDFGVAGDWDCES